MKTHQDIDRRSLALAREIAKRIDADPERKGLFRAREVCIRWLAADSAAPAIREWSRILADDWDAVRAVLLDDGQEGRRLRQSSPFCGVLSPSERWAFLRQYDHETTSA